MEYNEYKAPTCDEFFKDLKRAVFLSDEELKGKNLVGVLSKGEYYEYCSRIIREIHSKYNIIISYTPNSYEDYLIGKGVLKFPKVSKTETPKKKSIWNKLFKH